MTCLSAYNVPTISKSANKTLKKQYWGGVGQLGDAVTQLEIGNIPTVPGNLCASERSKRALKIIVHLIKRTFFLFQTFLSFYFLSFPLYFFHNFFFTI